MLSRRPTSTVLPSRSLVDRLSHAYLFWVMIAYGATMAGLWWSAHYIVEDNLKKQVVRLVPEFDEMGTPLFFTDNSLALERVRKQAEKNADILFVRYYRASDLKILGQYTKNSSVQIPVLLPPQARDMHRPDFAAPVALIDRYMGIVTALHAVAPVRTHSMKDDSMLDMGGLDDRRGEKSNTIGFLDVGMDVEPSRAVVVNVILVIAGLLTQALLFVLFFGRRHVRKSLDSLLQLQEPLKQVAAGNFRVKVKHFGRDLEIATVCEAVNTTIEALRQRNAEKEEALHAKLAAEAASQAKSQFLAHMSHEIRTPLNGILGFLKLLSNTTLTETQHDYLHTTEVSAKMLLSVINDILDFSKIEAGKISLEQVELELRELLEEGISPHVATAENKGLDLVFVFSKAVPTHLLGDPARISQVLSNLVGNAIKFTQHGEVLIDVELMEETDANVLVEISVKDSGIGIQDEALERLFQPFSQADVSTTRKYGGTGLGLIISKRLVELMGGEISVESHAGKGSRFAFTLRLPKQKNVCDCSPFGEIMVTQRILTVTSSAGVARSLSENLAVWGIPSDRVGDSKAALAALAEATDKQRAYTAIIFDDAVKDMTPKEFSARIKSLAGLPETPMLLLGGVSASHCPGESQLNEFASYICKPAKSSELYNKLSHIFISSKNRAADTKPQTLHMQFKKTDGKFCALIVDDNQINQKLAMLLVKQLGGESDIAENGAQAVDACHRKAYDLILMDIHMPIMDGVEATICIRESEKISQRHTLIIALTANALSGDRESYLAAGMDEYLSKPINEKAFASLLHKCGLTVAAPVGGAACHAEMPADAEKQTALAILDPQAGVELSFGSRETWRTALGMLFNELSDYSANLIAATTSGDLEKLRLAAHKLAGASSYCGTPAMNHAAKRVENLAKTGDEESTMQAAEALLQQIEQLLGLKKNGNLPDSETPIYALPLTSD